MTIPTPTPLPKSTAVINGKTVDVLDPRYRITILSPSYDYQLTEFYHNAYCECRALTAHYRMPDGSVQQLPVVAGRINLPGDSHIDRARNFITNVWVEQNPFKTDFGLWWDVDIPHSPRDIQRFLVHAMNGYQFVCGCYAMKCLEPRFVFNVAPNTPPPDPQTGLMRLKDAGTGSMLWHIDVPLALQKHPLVKPFKTAANAPFPGVRWWSYFPSGVQGPKVSPDLPIEQLPDWESEDWQACRDWQDMGGIVWGDTEIKLHHFGRMLYPPTIAELVNAVSVLFESRNPDMAPHVERITKSISSFKTETRPLAA